MLLRVHTICLLLALASAITRSQAIVVPQQPVPIEACAARAVFPGAHPASVPASTADPGFDVTWYQLNLTISASQLAGAVTVKAHVVADTARTIALDLINAMQVDSVIVGGRRMPFSQFPASLLLTLDRGYARGELFTATVYYHGFPVPTGFGSFEFSGHAGTPWVWSLSEPYGARDWWPCKDVSTDKADSVDVIVTCSSALTVGSNGLMVSDIDHGDGTRTVHWSERYPIAPYLVSVALTNYAQFINWFHYSPTDSMEIINDVLPEHLASAKASLPNVVNMLEVFSRLYGEYPFIKEKYGHAEFGLGGAMEHQTMTSTTRFDEGTISHELTHQWFGDLITCADWPDLWLNEGFASYGQALYAEAAHGEAAYWQVMNAFLSDALKATGTLWVQDTTDIHNLFNETRVYAKGASLLHMLRHIVGDSVYFRILHSYTGDPALRYGTATTADFQRVCEAVSGKDLGYFFSEWVYGEQYPRYAISWTAKPAGAGYQVSATLGETTNTANPVFFQMPVDLLLTAAGWDTLVTVFHAYNGEVFVLPSSHRPDSIIVDPGHWILRNIVPPNPDLPGGYSLDQNYPNPFNPATTITFHLPRRSDVALVVYNVLGEEVATLTRGRREAGDYAVSWDGLGPSGSRVASGVYMIRLTADQFSTTRKMLLLR